MSLLGRCCIDWLVSRLRARVDVTASLADARDVGRDLVAPVDGFWSLLFDVTARDLGVDVADWVDSLLLVSIAALLFSRVFFGLDFGVFS